MLTDARTFIMRTMSLYTSNKVKICLVLMLFKEEEEEKKNTSHASARPVPYNSHHWSSDQNYINDLCMARVCVYQIPTFIYIHKMPIPN